MDPTRAVVIDHDNGANVHVGCSTIERRNRGHNSEHDEGSMMVPVLQRLSYSRRFMPSRTALPWINEHDSAC